MEPEEAITAERERREEEDFLNYLERAEELTQDWPDWKRSVLRAWPNSAATAVAREPERRADNGQADKGQDEEPNTHE
jgi:hypothetical protein